ncbi:activator-dependent family glycosyltransferase [Crossiella sp. SN42]|uniref:activator-dependent family glycosyltransferase n=1 Tax=Crossiella sp. SN42 TaxID=2944808 RepID=UPI00207C998B|nr:activator-dependent family glycosyltransferase [Crossiella sp. SN42]MCO1574617.1 activator-dependent family glycosyltransferase [Crossiella sp. SN42]
MRVLCTTFAAPSHLNLMVPLAWALRCAGHQVRVASQPNLAEAIKDAGLTAVPVGAELDLAGQARAWGGAPADGTLYRSGLRLDETRPSVLDADYVRGALALYGTAISGYLADELMLAELVGHARSWRPDLVLWDALTYAGPIAARVCGAAHARVLFGPDHLGRMHRLLGSRRDDPLTAWLTARAQRHGCDYHDELAVGALTLDPMPAWMRQPTGLPQLAVRFVPYSGRGDLPDWLARPPARPRVCLTLGLASRAGALTALPVADLLAAVAGLDVEVVATLDSQQLAAVPEVPDNVRLVDFVPLEALLPSCAAIVHHLGAGTMATAVLCGVPQLCVVEDNTIWGEPGQARQLVARGAALAVRARELTPGTLARQLSRLLTEPAFATSAAGLRAEMLATPSPHEVVPRLEELAAGRAGVLAGSA